MNFFKKFTKPSPQPNYIEQRIEEPLQQTMEEPAIKQKINGGTDELQSTEENEEEVEQAEVDDDPPLPPIELGLTKFKLSFL